jgi:hypothetical protein
MTINVSALNSTLQTKINALDAATDTKEILLLSKALDAAAGSIAVSDVLDEGVVQVNNVNDKGAEKVAEVNALATNTFKTVGGSSILGSGDIATLPSGGSAGQVLKKDGSNNASWGLGGGLLQTVATSYNGYQSFNSNSFVQSSVTSGVINLVGGTSSKFIVSVHLEGEWDHEKQWSMYRSINGGSYQLCPWGNGAGSPNYGLAHFNLDYDVDNNSTIHQANGSYIDSPSASSSIEYRVYIKCSGGDMWLNRTHGGNPYAAGVCRVVTMEVGV